VKRDQLALKEPISKNYQPCSSFSLNGIISVGETQHSDRASRYIHHIHSLWKALWQGRDSIQWTQFTAINESCKYTYRQECPFQLPS